MASVACVIPAYNEEKFIADVIRGVPSFIQHIVVVNDASRDRTVEKVTELNDPRVTLVSHAANTGVGGAVISGYRRALEIGADVVIKMDGDGQMEAKNIRKLLAPILSGHADYAKGVRFRDREVIRRMPMVRFIGNLGLSFLTKLSSGYWNIFDPTNGFTAINRAALESLTLDRISRGFFFETDMLIHLYMVDAVVADVQMKALYGNETSSLNPAKVFVTFPMRLLGGFMKRIVWRYFIKDFTAFSAFFLTGISLFSFGSLFGLYKWITNGFIYQVATPVGTIMMAVVPLILGFQLILQAVVLDINNVPAVPLQRNHNHADE